MEQTLMKTFRRRILLDVAAAAAALTGIGVITSQAQDAPLQFLAPAEIPRAGAFWSAQLTNLPPLPFDPFGAALPVCVWDATNGIFVIADQEVDYPAWRALQQSGLSAAGVPLKSGELLSLGEQMSTALPPGPGEGGYGAGACPPRQTIRPHTCWVPVCA